MTAETTSTMTFHPRPQGGEARPWAFPAPDRATLANGLTVLTCHRPGQQVVAVEVCLAAPLDAEPAGLDGVAMIMARAFSEGTDTHTAEEFAAELERSGATMDAHADHPGVRVSLEVPVSRLRRGLTLLADALRAPAFPDDEIERLVANRLDEIPHELANPGRRAAMALYADRHDAVWPAQLLGTYCLGGTLTSRLDVVLREEKGYTYGVRASAQSLRSPADGTGAALLAIGGSVETDVTGPALADTWQVLRSLADGLTDAERDAAADFLVGVAPLRYETSAAVAGTLADQVEQQLPDDYQAVQYARLAATGTVEATAAVLSAFPTDRLVTVLVGDAEKIAEPVRGLGIGEVRVVPG